MPVLNLYNFSIFVFEFMLQKGALILKQPVLQI